MLLASTVEAGLPITKDTNGYRVPANIRALKYGAFVHYVWGGSGTRKPGSLQVNGDGTKPYKTLDEMVNAFPVKKFADDIASMGVEYLIFTCWHYDMNPLYPSAVMDKWMKGLPDKTPDRDLIRELIQVLKPHGVKLFLYIHPDDGHDFTDEEKSRVGYSKDWDKYGRFMNEMYAEVAARYGKDVAGYWNDAGQSRNAVKKGRLRKTIQQADPDGVCLSNFSPELRDINSLEGPYNIGRHNDWKAYEQHVASMVTHWWAYDQFQRCTSSPEDLYRVLVMQAGANTQGMGMAISFGVYGDGTWPTNVLEHMQGCGKLIEPIAASIKGVYASKAYPTASGTPYKSIDWGVATDSADGSYVYIHVLKPKSKSISGQTLALPAPADQRTFEAAALLRNGHAVELRQAANGTVTLTLAATDDWHELDTIIRLTALAAAKRAGAPSIDVDKAYLESLRTEMHPKHPPEVSPGVLFRHKVAIGKAGTRDLQADVFTPRHIPTKPRPAIVFLHGGSWKFGSPSQFHYHADYLAREYGFFAVSVDYRLSGEAKFPAALQDAKCDVRWVRSQAKKLNIGPDRIALCGGSAGANLSSLVATTAGIKAYEGDGGWQKYSSKADLAILFNGEFDMWDLVRKGSLIDAMRDFLGGYSAKIPEKYDELSSVKRIHVGCPPTLLLHGTKDTCVVSMPSWSSMQATATHGSIANRIEPSP